MKSDKMPIESDANELIALTEEIINQQKYKQQFLANFEYYKKQPDQLRQFLRGKRPDDYIDSFDQTIAVLLDRIDKANLRILADVELQETKQQEPSRIVSPHKSKRLFLSKRTRRQYLKEIGANEEIIERLIHPKKEKKERDDTIEYTVYKPSAYGKLSNAFIGSFVTRLFFTHKDFFDKLQSALRNSDVKVLSKTYVSMQFFTSVMAALVIGSLSILLGVFLGTSILFTGLLAITLMLVSFLITFMIFYMYPTVVAGTRSRQIKNDLPFVIINMAAVAGSGAKPIAMFKLLLNSEEYKGVESEIRKLVNYVNLFGYDISTAMKTVAATTPSKDFKELLIGMVSSIESGGSLKSFLQSKADESISSYKLDRNKYVEMISTYSDIYTSVMIAAPLLFLVTLAIISVLGGNIGGFSVSGIAIVGTFVVIPILNVLFILFLNIVQPEI